MKLRSFLGGVHPAPAKGRTGNSPIATAPLPPKVVIPLAQGGAPCEPLVKVGDTVLAGQKIGDSQAFVSAPVHASISGKVTALESVACPTGRSSLAVVIESDSQDSWINTGGRSLADLSAADVKDLIREAGLVGMGGAMFPTQMCIRDSCSPAPRALCGTAALFLPLRCFAADQVPTKKG